jgi:predicted permease
VKSRVSSLWRNLVHRRRVERDMDKEVDAVFDLLIDEQLQAGKTVEEARRAATLALGGMHGLKERVREARTGMTVDALLQDLRYAWRHVRRSPGFALAAILTLALGIGANTAMFSMLNALTVQRLAIEDPDGLIAIRPTNSRGLPRSTPVAAVDELREGPLEHVCGYLGGTVLPVLANDVPVQTLTTFVTAQCFNAFGVTPILGRAISEAEAPIYGAGAHVAMISHRLWTGAFAGDPAVLGKSLLVNNVSVTIVGVLPRGFVGLEVDYGVDVFTPFDAVLAAAGGRRQLAAAILGRLRPGVTLEQAATELRTRWPAVLEVAVPATLPPAERANLRDSIPRLERLGTGLSTNRERYARPLTLILGLTSLLLLLACVNLGGLLLARLAARSGELAVRLALGGTRWRIAQQMLIESLVLSLAGAALAIPLAYALVRTLASFIPPANVPHTMSLTPDVRVLAATGLVAVAAGVAISAIPIWVAIHRRASAQVTGDRTIAGTTSRWGRALLVAQVALSVVMLVGAALLTRSLYLLQHADLGIRTAGILNVKVFKLPNGQYNLAHRETYYPPMLEKIAALPGVHAAALAMSFPRGVSVSTMAIALVGAEPSGLMAATDRVSPSFFDTMGIPLIAGRGPTWADTPQTRAVAIVSESLARALSPDGDVLERHIRYGSLPGDQDITIVGIVGNATRGDPRDARAPVLYRPALQLIPESAFNPNLLIATDDPPTVATGVRQILREGGHEYAQEIVSLDDVLARAPASERMSASVAAAAGGLAVLLALIGVHGALAYSVLRRRREIGVRLAIGATPAAVAFGIVREGFMLTALGAAIGLPVAFLAARSLRALMFGISEVDLLTFAVVVMFFLVLGAGAGLGPAWRAAVVDPVTALRAE